ncbi:MAG: polymorphic toxin-type HINT domain-containing protein [Gemmataceae bacterium]
MISKNQKPSKLAVVWLCGCLLAAAGVLFGLGSSSSAPRHGPTYKKIEDIQVGDVVMARDEHTGQMVPRKVTRIFRNTSDHVRILQVRTAEGSVQKIETTDGHPFWVEGQGWVHAGALQAGHNLIQPDEQIATVVLSDYESRPQGVSIYNFEVEGVHTYFIAQAGGGGFVWVHNMSSPAGTPPSPGILPNRGSPPSPGNRPLIEATAQNRFEIINGKYVDANGVPLDGQYKAIVSLDGEFVMVPSWAGTHAEAAAYGTSRGVEGVHGAGSFWFENGVPVSADLTSGHYTPSGQGFADFLTGAAQQAGYQGPAVSPTHR